ncbi:hypothetical protein H5410_015973 [Solanum commersonii]|uniref:CCHC-type domain-containing protein n=1 Tax=Solanum commersonii TaxID=4109 RepID=A0A9J5ZV01_SOLCO|nr:hypothetical protein H5410_015973 [Solanum commersonii]
MAGNINQYKGKQPQRFQNSSQRIGGLVPRSNNFQQSQGSFPRYNNFQQSQKGPRQLQKFKGKKPKYDPNDICTHCGKIGHVDDNCYRLIGFPEDFQFTHDKGQQSQIRGNGAVILDEAKDDNYADTGNINQHFNKGQVNFLMHAFKQMKVADTPRNTTNPDINANAVAGTMLKYFGSCFSVFNSNTWIIDSAKEGLYLLDPSPMDSRFKDNVFETHPQFSNLSSISLLESVSFPVCSNTLSDKEYNKKLSQISLISYKLEHNHLIHMSTEKFYKSHRNNRSGSKRPLQMTGNQENQKIRLFRTVIIDPDDDWKIKH